MPIWIKPNAGIPQLREGKTIFPLQPAEFAAYVPALVAAGANFIGGCCGTNPDFIRAIRATVSVETWRKKKPPPR
jgi:5-methyltetrahydrofolate--homocysteine methyltransferase